MDAPTTRDWLSRLHHTWNTYRYPFIIFVTSRAAIVLIAILAAHYDLSVSAQRWDAVYYPRIAAHGYTFNGHQGNGNTIAFLPLYPLTIWALHTATTIPYVAAGYILSFVFGLAAVLALYRFITGWHQPQTALMAVSLVSFAPFSIFFSTTYAESLLLLLITLSLYYLWQRRPVIAAIPIGLALITKATAFALFPCLLAIILSRTITIRTKITAVCLASAPLMAFILYQWEKFSTPFAFLQAERIGWNKTLAWPWTGLNTLIQQLFTTSGALHTMWLVESCGLLLALILLIYGFRRLPWICTLFTGLAILLVISTNWPLSLSRYVLALAPLYIAAALALKHAPYVRLWLFPVLATLMGFFALQFLQGGYVL